MAADSFDHCVDDRAPPAGVFSADEHPVFHAELGGADCVLGEVVVELDPSVFEAGLEVGELFVGVREGFAQRAGGGDCPAVLEVVC